MAALVGVGGKVAHHRQRAFDEPVDGRMPVRQLEKLQGQPEAIRLRADDVAAFFQQEQDAVDFVDRAPQAVGDLGLREPFGLVRHQLQYIERLFGGRGAVLVAAAFAFVECLDDGRAHQATLRDSSSADLVSR
jgi:hypothetical protein